MQVSEFTGLDTILSVHLRGFTSHQQNWRAGNSGNNLEWSSIVDDKSRKVESVLPCRQTDSKH